MPHRLFATSFGPCGMAWEGSAVTGFQLPEKDESATAARLAARDRARGPDEPPPAWLQRLVERVQAHLAGRLEDFADVPLDWTRVSDFQRAVYRQTQAVKAGHKRSYGEVARALALGPESARAVGVALAANPWPLLVPCHRIVSAGDKMTGFSGPGGVRTKTRLLALEGAELLSE